MTRDHRLMSSGLLTMTADWEQRAIRAPRVSSRCIAPQQERHNTNRDAHARPVREHLHAGLDYQDRLVRFMENHDEPRAAATFAAGIYQAAAIITYLSPGLRFFHQASSKAGENASRRTWRADRRRRSILSCEDSTTAFWPCCGSRSSGTVRGACSNARRHGRATGPGIALSRGPGSVKMASGGSLRSTTPTIRASATHGFHLQT